MLAGSKTDLEKTQRLGVVTYNFDSLLTSTAISKIQEILISIRDKDPEAKEDTINKSLGTKEERLLAKVVINAHESWQHNKSYGKQESIEDLIKLFTTPTGRTSILFSENEAGIKVSGSSLFILISQFYPKEPDRLGLC